MFGPYPYHELSASVPTFIIYENIHTEYGIHDSNCTIQLNLSFCFCLLHCYLPIFVVIHFLASPDNVTDDASIEFLGVVSYLSNTDVEGPVEAGFGKQRNRIIV